MTIPTEKEIIEKAQKLGCTIEIYGVVGIGIAMVAALQMVRDRRYQEPVRITVDVAGLRFLQEVSSRAIEAAYLPETGVIIINGQSDTYVRYEPGRRVPDIPHGAWGPRVVSAHPLAPLLHMIGHAIHHAQSPTMYEKLMTLEKHDQPWWIDEIREIPENFVSETAMETWMAFAAEVFTALVLGIEMSTVVMKHYRRIDGAVPPTSSH